MSLKLIWWSFHYTAAFKKLSFLGAYFKHWKCYKIEKMKIFPEGKPSLDGLLLLKTKNNIIRKSLDHSEVQKPYIIKYQVLLSKT